MHILILSASQLDAIVARRVVVRRDRAKAAVPVVALVRLFIAMQRLSAPLPDQYHELSCRAATPNVPLVALVMLYCSFSDHA